MGENYKNKDWLKQKHVVEKLSFDKIGKMEGVLGSKISYWAKKLGITHTSHLGKKRIKLVGGDGYVKYTCEFCKHIMLFKKVNPTQKEIEKWLRNIECEKCKRKRIIY